MPIPALDTTIVGGLNPAMGNVSEIPTHKEILAINEKRHSIIDSGNEKDVLKVSAATVDDDSVNKDSDDEDRIIVTGADAAKYLLPLRDDHESSLTFRSIFLATILSAFQACMYQIYSVSCICRQLSVKCFNKCLDDLRNESRLTCLSSNQPPLLFKEPLSC